jgi:sugar phosphate isomerase/epimerase
VSYSRREFAKLALAGLPAAALFGRSESIFAAPAKPKSVFGGVQIGAITYSYRSLHDQSAEATLKYLLGSGLSACELMDGPAEMFAGGPETGRGGGPGGFGGGSAPAVTTIDPKDLPPGAKIGEWHGQQCVIPADGGDPISAAAFARGAAGGGGRGRGRGRGEQTPEQQAAQQEAAAKLKAWRTSVSMDRFKQLRRMYHDAGVTIYAYKTDGMQKNMQTSNEELDYMFNVAAALGATHTTMELPSGPDAEALLKRMAAFAEKHKIHIAYHTHLQGSMTAFDQAFAISKWNMANVDLGHWVAGGNKGGTPMDFLAKYHARTSSFHIKDRTTPAHCGLNLPWGEGETPLAAILQLVKQKKWKIPASIELEYDIPEGSDAVAEVKKCVEFCRKVLA